LAPLRRFVIGDGSRGRGFVLSHPKIAEYLQSQRYQHAERLTKQAFVDWGRHEVDQVNNRPELASQTSAYLVQYYRRHLQELNAPREDFVALVGDGWRRAWEHFEGGQQGFSSDVGAAWREARGKSGTEHL